MSVKEYRFMKIVSEKLAQDQFTQLKLKNLKTILAESIAQADRGELHSINDVFASLTKDKHEDISNSNI